jgi:hypothetical protein
MEILPRVSLRSTLGCTQVAPMGLACIPHRVDWRSFVADFELEAQLPGAIRWIILAFQARIFDPFHLYSIFDRTHLEERG